MCDCEPTAHIAPGVAAPPNSTPMLNLDDLARLEAAATPWHSHDVDGYWYIYGPDDFQINNSFNSSDTSSIKANEALIAAARNNLPALIATARTYDALLAAVGAVVSCTSTDAENAALEALSRLWEAQTGAQPKENHYE